MIATIKGAAYAMSGFSGLTLMNWLAYLIATRMRGAEGINKDAFDWCVAGAFIGLSLFWHVFPRMRFEVFSEVRFMRWYWLLAGSMFVLFLTHPSPSYWRDVNWVMHTISFGVITDVQPVWSPVMTDVIHYSSIVLAIATIHYGWVRFEGFDQRVLVGVSVAGLIWIVRVVFPVVSENISLILVGFVVLLGWGGPLGENARTYLRFLLSLFQRRPAAPSTTLDVPEDGTHISKL